MILVLDAYDSFVETLARYLREAGEMTRSGPSADGAPMSE